MNCCSVALSFCWSSTISVSRARVCREVPPLRSGNQISFGCVLTPSCQQSQLGSISASKVERPFRLSPPTTDPQHRVLEGPATPDTCIHPVSQTPNYLRLPRFAVGRIIWFADLAGPETFRTRIADRREMHTVFRPRPTPWRTIHPAVNPCRAAAVDRNGFRQLDDHSPIPNRSIIPLTYRA